MLFSDIVGHQEVKNRLIQSIQDNRVSHAQLFLGREGSGNLPLAIAYAQYLSCGQRGEADACGRCSSCIKYQKLIHPDLHFVFPVATTKKVSSRPVSSKFSTEWREALLQEPYMSFYSWMQFIGVENKQGFIRAEESNEIIKKLSLKTYESEFKVMIIWLPEKFHPAAANKLLKIIEEPPAKTLFLLVSEDEEAILKTIVSRTQLLKVGRIDEADIQQALIEKEGISREEAARVARVSEGSYLEAKKHLQQDEEEHFFHTTFADWMRLCFKAKVADLIKWSEEMAGAGRERQKNFLTYGLEIFRESLMMNYGAGELMRVGGETLKFTEKFAPYVHAGNCMELTEAFNTACYHIERNANPKILFLDLSLSVTKLLRVKNVTLQNQ